MLLGASTVLMIFKWFNLSGLLILHLERGKKVQTQQKGPIIKLVSKAFASDVSLVLQARPREVYECRPNQK
jgi:hypothetical protein